MEVSIIKYTSIFMGICRSKNYKNWV